MPETMAGKKLVRFDKTLCIPLTIYILVGILVPVGITAFAGFVGGIYYWRKKSYIHYKWYLYKHKNQTQTTDFDVQKPYDAYICYSTENIGLIKKMLLKVLEVENELIPLKFLRMWNDLKESESIINTTVPYVNKMFNQNSNMTRNKNGLHVDTSSKNKYFRFKANKERVCVKYREASPQSSHVFHKVLSIQPKATKGKVLKNTKRKLLHSSNLRFEKSTYKYRAQLSYHRKRMLSLKFHIKIHERAFAKLGLSRQQVLGFGANEEQYGQFTCNLFTDLSIPNIHGEENEPGYKLVVPDRDFLIGSVMEDTIVEYIEQSRKSLVCLSKEFLDSKYAMFAFDVITQERKNDMLVIMLDDMHLKKELPKSMRSVIKNKLYLQWNDVENGDEFQYKLFYKRLKDFLGMPNKGRMQELENSQKEEMEMGSQMSLLDPLHHRDVLWRSYQSYIDPNEQVVLLEADKEAILNTRNHISKKVITIALQHLKKDYPNLFVANNIDNVTDNLRLEEFGVERGRVATTWPTFLTVCKVEEDHWLIISSHDCIRGQIKVYDSKNSLNISHSLQNQIARAVQKYKESKLTVQLMNVCAQQSAFDSGLHVIANIISLANNIDLSRIQYKGSEQMRKHLKECFEKETIELTEFPMKKSKVSSATEVIRMTRPMKLYCNCYSPWERSMKKCTVCQNYFHQKHMKHKTIISFKCDNCKI